MAYRVEPATAELRKSLRGYAPERLALLEKLNRADRAHLDRLPALVLPGAWDLDELQYSPLPRTWEASRAHSKLFVILLSGQVFAAYEHGALVRWGPVSSGFRADPTPSGLFHLNWKSRGRHSTVDPEWYMRWYFNFENRQGRALHAYTMPGYPASHGCLRLLERDAIWLYEWGDSWQLAPGGREILREGTPVLILGRYEFEQPPPWRSLEWLGRGIELPDALPLSAPAVQESRARNPR